MSEISVLSEPETQLVDFLEQERLLNLEKIESGKKSRRDAKKKKGSKRGSSKASSAKSKTPGSPGKKSKKPKEPQPLPFEVIYERYYIEITWVHYEIMIILIYMEPIEMWHLVKTSNAHEKFALNLKKLLLNPLFEYGEEEIDQTLTGILPETPENYDEVTQILDLVPFKGHLLPYEAQTISFSLHRVKNIDVKLRAMCHVTGGPTEPLDMFGVAADISYYIDKTYVNFHRQVNIFLL